MMLGQMTLFQPDKTLPLRQRVSVEIVTLAQVRGILEKFHYLHRVRTGRQINYAVLIDGVVDGVITYAYAMTSAAICEVPSDEYLEFARLWLSSNIPHTASCAIGKSLKRIKNDWIIKFSDAKPPRLVVSWSDKEYHKGTIYKAANFVWLRESLGQLGPDHTKNSKRGKRITTQDRKHHKDCWIYELK